ncbi:hypothetical protein SADUNF_Sadunf10G0086200 [Salix dunnii]|uniref:Uncharacterized protein n=1 Tax=Salix dunnii TaxID=1413687 RepID=A0A835JQE7_9ROSI|nr:hypothetical protein SADUNF_Sadunf10G0086200 [Salix dunnii]
MKHHFEFFEIYAHFLALIKTQCSTVIKCFRDKVEFLISRRKLMEPNADLLEWSKKDKRRLLHAVYCAGDLERTIKCVTLVVANVLWVRLINHWIVNPNGSQVYNQTVFYTYIW